MKVRVTNEKLRADHLALDERVQRSIRSGHLKRMTRNLDPLAVGVIHVSRRNGDENRDVILDGQHRVRALIDSGLGEHKIDCRVYHDLTLAQEAGLFRRLNVTVPASPVDDFVKGVLEGDEECVAISKIVERFGLRVALQKGDGIVACIATLRRTYRRNPAALGFALHVATEAWGTRRDAFDAYVLGGLGEMYARYQEEIDRPALIRKLAKYRGGPAGLQGSAKAMHQLRGGTVARATASLLVDTYNKGRRTGDLPPI